MLESQIGSLGTQYTPLDLLTYVRELPSEAAVAKFLSRYIIEHLPSDGPSRGSVQELPETDDQPEFWLFLPGSTAGDFPNCQRESLRRLALASTYGILYNAWLDAAVDQPDRGVARDIVVSQWFFLAMQHQLRELFPATSPFWQCFSPYCDLFLDTLLEETQRRKQVTSLSYQEYCCLARGKMAMAMVNPIGLAILSKEPERVPALAAAWDELNVAVVILDDIQDWQEDFLQANYTYLLKLALANALIDRITIEEVTDKVVVSGVIELLYAAGAGHLKRATDLARIAGAPALAVLAKERMEMFLRFRSRLINRKVALGLRYLQRSSGFVERSQTLGEGKETDHVESRFESMDQGVLKTPDKSSRSAQKATRPAQEGNNRTHIAGKFEQDH